MQRGVFVKRRVSLFSALAFSAAMLAPMAQAAPAPQACEFKLGFAALASLIPDEVGQCLADESFNPVNGDSRQPTTGGLLVWRKADNWTVFTNGTSTWLNGPQGLQQRANDRRFTWEIDAGSFASAEADASLQGLAELLPEDLLAATLNTAEVQALAPSGQQWWEGFPYTYRAPFAGAPDTAGLGQRLAVGRFYQTVQDTEIVDTLDLDLLLFADQAAATAAMDTLAARLGEERSVIPGPLVGDEATYFTADDEEEPANELASVLFRSGAVVGNVRVTRRDPAESVDVLARYANAMEAKVDALQAGLLSRTPLPAEWANVLPIGGEGVGMLMGSAVTSPQSWALIDTTNDPVRVMTRFQSFGASELVVRSFTLGADDEHLVELTLMPFGDEGSAAEWVAAFIEETNTVNVALEAGATGPNAAFSQSEFGYELQFAKGRFVGDVFCYAPYGEEASAACEEPVRRLAEQWYAMLPAE